MSEWKPIETAPRDGTEVLLATPEGVDIGAWLEGYGPSIDDPGLDSGWSGKYAFSGCTSVRRESPYYHPPANQPTHWMLLPEPPA